MFLQLILWLLAYSPLTKAWGCVECQKMNLRLKTENEGLFFKKLRQEKLIENMESELDSVKFNLEGCKENGTSTSKLLKEKTETLTAFQQNIVSLERKLTLLVKDHDQCQTILVQCQGKAKQATELLHGKQDQLLNITSYYGGFSFSGRRKKEARFLSLL